MSKQQDKLIIVTGAAGFIGSALVADLNERGYTNLVLVDDFSRIDKAHNLLGKKYHSKVHRDQLAAWCEKHANEIRAIFHIGAKTDTMLQDKVVFKKLNIEYTKFLVEFATENDIPILYASSAATYGNGEHGYDDDASKIELLTPLNPYAQSKQDIDMWLLSLKQKPTHWYGFKFFNVYGPNEYHKGRMASVIFHTYRQILKNGKVTLFKSHNPNYEDGKQMRDFIYVKDVTDVLIYFFEQLPSQNGIYNLGTGQARTFLDLVNSLFQAIHHQANIDFIDTPIEIRDKYQYFTEANMQKLRSIGYNKPFHTLEAGVKDYAQQYLETAAYL